jgi:8-oxo-dGTP pyrophosphatase MutT (NUDIX family)
MASNLANQITEMINQLSHINLHNAFKERLISGNITKQENPESHFCVFFLPHNKQTGEVFLVHHKKASKWISPGGHIDLGENIHQTLNREINEELGISNAFSKLPKPFYVSHLEINNEYKCKKHFDLWFEFETDGNNFQVDPSEFLDTKWLTYQEAIETTTDPWNKSAITIIQNSNI